MTTQYAVCHLERGAGNDSGMSCHIERKTADGKPHIPDNADENRKHLNREFIAFPDGVQNRTQAIQHRIETAGLQRKVGKNQTRAIRVLLTGTHEQMMALANGGRLDDWCRANIKWLHDTFGKDNLVSCVLHMDEKTPHLHATVVPIVTAPRTRRKREGEQKYKEKTPAPRLCANELMTRGKLRQYQDTYAQAMAGFGLKRGVVASGARHQTQQQYNRQQALELQSDIERLTAEIEKLDAEKKAVEKGAKDGKNRILSWLGTGELPKLEKEVADKDRQIAALQKQLSEMQKRHDDLKADSLREHNSYQKEIDAATKRVAKWEARYNAEHNRAKELHRLAYPERYRLSSGAELVSGWIPNRMYPSLSITTLFHGNEFKNTSYNLPQNLLDKYDSGAITLHELVNELFEPWEQVDESQHSLLAIALQTAVGVLTAGFMLGSTHDGIELPGIIPNSWVEWAVGGNSLLSNFFASFTGAFMYFATLTEVPIIQGLLASGMGKGPALALLLAGPSLSLPNMLVIRSVMGTKKTVIYVTLVIVMATISGWVYGYFF